MTLAHQLLATSRDNGFTRKNNLNRKSEIRSGDDLTRLPTNPAYG